MDICENDPNILINQNVIEKLSEISSNEKMNLNYIIGEIYLSLMSKTNIFDYDDDNMDDYLFIFIDEVIEFKDIMKNTRLGTIYNDSLKNFLFSITENVDLEDDELKRIKSVLEGDKDIPHNNLTKTSLDLLIISLTKELERQPDIYEQYKIFIQNKLSIINLIEKSDLEDKDSYNDYLKLGKYLAYLFYNNTFSLLLKNNNDKDEMMGIKFLFYDGYENQGEMNIINGEQYYIEEDDKIKQLREQLCEIIIKYAETYIDLNDIFAIQYLIYALMKRIYFCNYEKHNKKVIPILAYSLVNMCFFEEAPLQLISSFINTILKSTEKKDEELKKYLLEDINESKDDKYFLYKIPKFVKLKDQEENKEEEKKEEDKEKKDKNEEEEDDVDESEDEIDEGLTKNKSEVLPLYNNDLKIGFLNYITINSGKKFIFYEKIDQSYSVLDFSFVLEDLDIKLTITDLTENRVIYNKDKLDAVFETPLKIIMLFTSPRILKFEIDNSYSWMRAKKIKYSINVFCPQSPYSIIHQILISKYQKTILQTKKKMLKNDKNKKKQKSITDEADQLLIIKIDGENKVYNCINVTQNIEAINKMVKDKYLTITSLFIKTKTNEKKEQNDEDKSYFYYYKKDEGLIENELKEEIFEQYLSDKLSKSNGNFNLVNLYVINGDSNNQQNYNYYSINKLLGFEPKIKVDGNKEKTIFIIQNLGQAQLLFQLYKQVYSQEYQDNVLLINYTKFGGYQILLFNNEDIVSDLSDFNGVNKSASIDENINIIYNGIKKLKEDERSIDVVLTSSIDDKENEIVPDKLEEKLKEKIGDNENDKKNIKIIKTDLAFNEDLQISSHVFYLDN